MNVTKIRVDDKKLVASIETERGHEIQLTFNWELKFPELEKAVSVLQQAILQEAKKAEG